MFFCFVFSSSDSNRLLGSGERRKCQYEQTSLEAWNTIRSSVLFIPRIEFLLFIATNVVLLLFFELCADLRSVERTNLTMPEECAKPVLMPSQICSRMRVFQNVNILPFTLYRTLVLLFFSFQSCAIFFHKRRNSDSYCVSISFLLVATRVELDLL